MEKNLLKSSTSFRLYKDRSIYVGTLLGGPLVAAYLIAENFKSLGQRNKLKTTWSIGVVATVIIFWIAYNIPDNIKIPNFLIPLMYSGISQYLVKRFQGEEIKAHLDSGGQFYAVWRAALVGLVGLIILLAIVFAMTYFLTPDAQ